MVAVVFRSLGRHLDSGTIHFLSFFPSRIQFIHAILHFPVLEEHKV